MASKADKKAVQRIGKAVEELTHEKRQYILGYADGVLAAAERQKEAKQ